MDGLAEGVERWRRTGYGVDPNQCRPGVHPVVASFPPPVVGRAGEDGRHG